MHDRIRGLRVVCALFVAATTTLPLAACGGSSDQASSLLQQTFKPHTVKSGVLDVSFTLKPTGSSTLKGPITISFGGPFQTTSAGQLPQSNFTVSLSAVGSSVSLGILSTGTNGYVTLQGTSYQLPAATFQKLESSFAQLASSPGGSGNGSLSKLGIHPLHWVSNPSVVGDENVAGADTTHIRATVNVAALLNDLNTFLEKAPSLGVNTGGRLPTSISTSTRQRIATEVKNPVFDVWTGKSDKTLRRLSINLTLPISGQIATALGGLSAANIGLSMQYADINQPQTIAAPSSVRPFSEFASKLQSFLRGLAGNVTGGLSGGGSSGTGSTASANSQAYTQCIQSAGSDIAKMQRCASLLSGK
jgi:hypothetical protein